MSTESLPVRKRPSHGVFISGNAPTIVFLTICTEDRRPWLTSEPVQRALEQVWRRADGWLVGHYLLMPDHLHLFCAPADLDVSLGQWARHWKRAFSMLRVDGAGRWQRDYWDTRLRRQEKYHEKWLYVQENPVRKGLVQRAEDWPFQGTMNTLSW